MKRIISALIVLFSSSLWAQTHINTIDYANEWTMHDGEGKKSIVLQGEILINGLRFHNLAPSYKYCYRQDGNKIYRYTKSTGKEQLVLDFDLKEGDVFPLYEGLSLQVDMVYDTLISDGWINEASCKCIHLRSVEQPTFQDTWIEGFGSVRYGINPPDNMKDLFSSNLMYAISNGFIYMTNFSNDDIWGMEVSLGEEHPNTNVPYPPYHWENDSLAFTLRDGILNINGYIRNDCLGPLYMLISEKEELITIDTYELPEDADCYSYYKANISIPNLDRDRYTLQYNSKNLKITKDSTTILLPVKPPYLVVEGLQWAKCYMYATTSDIHSRAFELNGDTIIECKTYKIERSTNRKNLSNMKPTNCFVREEAGKVYRREGSKNEYLWFDYKADIGDSIFYENSFVKVIGHSDTTITCNGTIRTYKGIDVQIGRYDNEGSYLIPGYVTTFYEQLGLFITGEIVEAPSFMLTGGKTELLWIKRDGELLYLNKDDVFWRDNTSINLSQKKRVNTAFYHDLQGRPVINPTHGIYIKDGKKVIISK